MSPIAITIGLITMTAENCHLLSYKCLPKTIVLYDGHYRLNAVFDGDKCTEITSLLSCANNEIEAERMLVQNLFATDDCGHVLIKLFSNASSFTDYYTPCAATPETFIGVACKMYYSL